MKRFIDFCIGTITTLLFFKSKDSDLTVKSAFMHLLADAIVSAGIVVGGIIIFIPITCARRTPYTCMGHQHHG